MNIEILIQSILGGVLGGIFGMIVGWFIIWCETSGEFTAVGDMIHYKGKGLNLSIRYDKQETDAAIAEEIARRIIDITKEEMDKSKGEEDVFTTNNDNRGNS